MVFIQFFYRIFEQIRMKIFIHASVHMCIWLFKDLFERVHSILFFAICDLW